MKSYYKKITFLLLGMGICILIIVGRAFYLQVIKYPTYKQIAEEKLLRIYFLNSYRGRILDRNKRLLAYDTPIFNVCIIPVELEEKCPLLKKKIDSREKLEKTVKFYINSSKVGETIKYIAKVCEVPINVITSNIIRAFVNVKIKRWDFPWTPQIIYEGIGIKKVILLEQKEEFHEGFQISSSISRFYPYREITSNVIGYVGNPTEKQMKELLEEGIPIKNIMIGKIGIEKYYDNVLRGTPGTRIVRKYKKAYGLTYEKIVMEQPPKNGKDIILTLDIKLQSILYKYMKGKIGAGIIIEPYSGEILAMVSVPSFDANYFCRYKNNKKISFYIHSKDAPLINRCIQSCYPTGSIFKLITGTAGLYTKKISSYTLYNCEGSLRVGNRDFLCWIYKYHTGHGEVDIKKALAVSCNVFFYKVALEIGVKPIIKIAKMMGIGEKTGVDLPFEKKGILPTPLWKKKHKKQSWYTGDTLHLAIGQGYLSATLIQVVRMISIFANGGYLIYPHLLKHSNFHKAKKLPIASSIISIIREGLFKVVNSPEGTAYSSRIENVSGYMAGKTGTAEVKGKKPHSWFAGFYPFDNPKIAFAIIVEHGGHGGSCAAPIIKKVIEEYYAK